MTSETLAIVGLRGRFHLVMRIVTRNAADTTIGRVVTLASGQSIRLESNVIQTMRPIHDYVRPCSVTSSAQIRDAFARKSGQVLHRTDEVTRGDS